MTQSEILRRLERECREECQQFIDEKVYIMNVSIRPMKTVLGSGVIEYGPYPPNIQAYLDHLDAQIKAVIWRYEKMASAQTQPKIGPQSGSWRGIGKATERTQGK